MIPKGLKKYVEEFLSTLRLGVDFGEAAGGIALVRCNEILHAETFVDFHNTTLETRRTLRRGRRTRHSKKMRLARLRSWLLRQKLTDGSRLPDPYQIMWDVEGGFQTKPGLYKTKGRSPREVDTWIEAAKKGEVDAEGFVCALTHLFQKRGYKYDDKELCKFSPQRLIDFLNSCCELAEAGDLAQMLDDEITRRESANEKNSKKLREAYRGALERPPELRRAIPRQIKEHDLRLMVQKFGENQRLSATTIRAWQDQLCGLLNRVLREARFDNRLKSTCSWCKKKTPRLAKPEIRRKVYMAAVGNLRVIEAGVKRSLTIDERLGFEHWWERRHSDYLFSKSSRTPVFERAPSEKNIEKAFQELRIAKSKLRDKKGQPYFGYAMLRQMNDLLNHHPRGGRASLCEEHLQMAADGKTMKDANVEWQTMRIRNAPNPCREQHDTRVLQRIERLLFRKGKTASQAWRYGPVSYITLEVPKPGTERVGKGQQTERRSKSLREILHEETGGICIYTGRTLSVEELDKDHIVPDSKGGPDVRLNLICASRDANREKDNRLPSEWLGVGSVRWLEFESRVKAILTLPEDKKKLLLLKPGEKFPADETPLAHVGARPRAFVAELVRLFKRYDVRPPTVNYVKGVPHVQRVDGRWTSDLRISWMWKDQAAAQPNFPEKNRADLFNHAQDAALLAATPPHTWRLQIKCDRAVRLCAVRAEDGQLVRDDRGKLQTELRMRPGLALLELAPDWSDFVQKRTRPIVYVLGNNKARWKNQLMDQSFYQRPSTIDDAFLRIHKPLDATEESSISRRKTTVVPKGGLLLRVPYFDKVARQEKHRKVQAKGASYDSVVLWRDSRGRVNFSRQIAKPLRKFTGHSVVPAIPDHAKILDRWHRGTLVPLPAKGEFLSGFYRVKEMHKGKITVIPENSITDEIRKRLDIPRDERKPREREIGKTELAKLFATQ